MRFPQPLVPATLLRRYKRFLADVRLADGSVAVAHVANPGSMLGLAEPGSAIWLAAAGGPGRRRKLDWSWQLAEARGAPVGVNTGLANRVVEEAILAGRIPALAGYASLRREVKYGAASRIDFLLEDPDRPPCYVEVKSVTLSRRPGLAEFPDSRTARGSKHLRELADMARAGGRAVMLYLAQRGDCDRFALAADIDPAYAAGLAEALSHGVETLCYSCTVTPEAIDVARPIPIQSSP
jgi:sugar fermentation stimulation protein A